MMQGGHPAFRLQLVFSNVSLSWFGMREMNFLVEYEAGTEDREETVGKPMMRMVRFFWGFLFALNYDFLMSFISFKFEKHLFLAIFYKAPQS